MACGGRIRAVTFLAGGALLAGWAVALLTVTTPGKGVAPSPTADLVLLNGAIYTGDEARPRAAALAISKEQIVAVGTYAEVRAWVGPSTRVIDLHGHFAMPGFNDAHTHLGSAGRSKLLLELVGCRTIEEMQQRIRGWIAAHPDTLWVVGRGWDHTLWPVQRFPTRQDLDAVSREHPMFFGRVDGHVAVANSKALELAGITKDTPDPPGSHIERDAKTGEPTGMLEEDAAQTLVLRRIPPPTPAERRRGLELVFAELAANGVTSAQDNSSWEDFQVYRELKAEGRLTARVTEWLPFDAPLEALETMRRGGGTADAWLKTGALKGFLDGAMGARTAALEAPYADDPSTKGILRVDPAEYTKMAIARDRAGFQIAFHAIGDRANRVALDIFAAILTANGPRDRRDRVEHAQVVAPSDFARFAALHVIASMQPSHETTDQRWADARLGPERTKGAYAWRTMLAHGVRLAFGTDYPVEIINPMRGVHACVTRESPEGQPPGGWEPQEKITMDECLRAYTQGSAYAEFEEDTRGRIAPGQLADVIVLSADLTRIPPRELLGVKVLTTIAGGRVVYEAP